MDREADRTEMASEAEDRDPEARSVAGRADLTAISEDPGWAGSQDRPMADLRLGADRPEAPTTAAAFRGVAAAACRSSARHCLHWLAQSCSCFCSDAPDTKKACGLNRGLFGLKPILYGLR